MPTGQPVTWSTFVRRPYIIEYSVKKQVLQVANKWEKHNTVSFDEIKQKVITQANDYHRVKAYTP